MSQRTPKRLKHPKEAPVDQGKVTQLKKEIADLEKETRIFRTRISRLNSQISANTKAVRRVYGVPKERQKLEIGSPNLVANLRVQKRTLEKKKVESQRTLDNLLRSSEYDHVGELEIDILLHHAESERLSTLHNNKIKKNRSFDKELTAMNEELEETNVLKREIPNLQQTLEELNEKLRICWRNDQVNDIGVVFAKIEAGSPESEAIDNLNAEIEQLEQELNECNQREEKESNLTEEHINEISTDLNAILRRLQELLYPEMKEENSEMTE